jgi:hypothetical protein
MPMDSISMCSNILYMSKMEVESSLRWPSASTMTYHIILTPQVTKNPKICTKQGG